MLRIESFTFNPFSENTYLLINDTTNNCWIIDPGMYGASEEMELNQYIKNNNLRPQQILNTHTHIDHIFGVDAMKAAYNIEFGMHQADLPVLQNAVGSATMFGFQFSIAPKPDFFIKENSTLLLDNEEIQVLLAPGHSPGSIIFYYPKGGFVISGDVLFQGSVGRSDLPGGNHDVLMNSIKNQLYTLPDETKVYSGHGEPTEIGIEKKINPFIRG